MVINSLSVLYLSLVAKIDQPASCLNHIYLPISSQESYIRNTKNGYTGMCELTLLHVSCVHVTLITWARDKMLM